MSNSKNLLEKIYKVGELSPKWVKTHEFLAVDKKVCSSSKAANLFRQFMDPDQLQYREMFYALFLNRNNEIVGLFKVSEGGISSTVVDPKVLLSQALLIGASGIIVCHNHPSGNIQPSQSDFNLTEKLKNAASYLDMSILDHVILTENNYYSFADMGKL
jgi:DNA repair protein RadC